MNHLPVPRETIREGANPSPLTNCHIDYSTADGWLRFQITYALILHFEIASVIVSFDVRHATESLGATISPISTRLRGHPLHFLIVWFTRSSYIVVARQRHKASSAIAASQEVGRCSAARKDE